MPLILIFGERQVGFCEGKNQLVYSETQDSEDYKETLLKKTNKNTNKMVTAIFWKQKKLLYVISMVYKISSKLVRAAMWDFAFEKQLKSRVKKRRIPSGGGGAHL